MSQEKKVIQAKCPKCKKPTVLGEKFSPFCSERCKILDLGAWANEEYRVKGEAVEDQALKEDSTGDG